MMLTTDPAKRYALLEMFTSKVARVLTNERVQYDPDWTRLIELEEDAVVLPGFVWQGDGFNDPNNIEQLRTDALIAVDSKAGEVRRRYITVAPGQEVTYLMKERHAEAFRAALYLGDVPPMIAAEVSATGQTPQQAADAILAQRDLWMLKAAQIEAYRRRGKVLIAAGETAQEVSYVRDAFLSTLDGL